jgi:hypothetical protein
VCVCACVFVYLCVYVCVCVYVREYVCACMNMCVSLCVGFTAVGLFITGIANIYLFMFF